MHLDGDDRQVLFADPAKPGADAEPVDVDEILKRPRWDLDRELLRTLIDAIRENTWLTACAAIPKPSDRPSAPEPLPKPWEETTDQRKARRTRELAALLRQRAIAEQERESEGGDD